MILVRSKILSFGKELILILSNSNSCRYHKQISIDLITLDWVPLSEVNDKTAESAEQDQTARMCSVILLNIIRKMKP